MLRASSELGPYGPWDSLATYPAGSVGAELQFLAGYAHTLAGTANEVIITSDAGGDLTASTPQPIGTSSDIQFRDAALRKLIPGPYVPTLASWGTGAGANSTPTAGSIGGSDIFVIVNVTPSATPATNATIAQISWSGGNGEFTVAPTCVVVPITRNGYGISYSAAGGLLATGGVNGITLTSGLTTALTAGTAYQFLIIVFGGT